MVPGRRLDVAGQLTALLGLGGVTYALIDGETQGWTSPVIVGSFVLGISAIVAFITIELHVRQPMLQLAMFRSQTVATVHVVRLMLGFVFFGILFFGSLYFQQVLGYTPLEAGVRWVPMTAAVALAGPFAGRLSAGDRRPPARCDGNGPCVRRHVPVLHRDRHVVIRILLVAHGSDRSRFGLVHLTVDRSRHQQRVERTGGDGLVFDITWPEQTGSVLGIAILGVIVTSRMDAVVRAGVNALSLPGAEKAWCS